MPLKLPVHMPHAIATLARAHGALPAETGGFILGSPGTNDGTVLAMTGERDIQRGRNLFAVGGLALATLFDWADDNDLSVLAQWHTHGIGAFLSKTDLEHGFDVPGFHTAVVPHYRTASHDPTDWGWWTFVPGLDGGWQEAVPPSVVEADYRSITFEKGRVHEH